ncbi:hypothetical protein [Streptomyces misionensis]|uniref:hypothetical protein n=1 Tax=Streptomyces misionensis TaxID=67331 RepID=UPI0033D80130
MSVTVTKTGGHTAQITWTPDDDPHGYLAAAVESDQLAYALQSLGDTETGHSTPTATPEQALAATAATLSLARLLERRAAVQVVVLKDGHDLTWRPMAEALLGDASKQSSVRRMYDSGRRHLGR